MAILSTVKKVIPYIKEAAGYVLCHISSQAVEMDDGTLLQDKIESMDSEIDGKANTSHTHTATQITGLTASRAMVSDGSGHPAVSNVTATELNYLDGATSNIQNQIDTLNSNLEKLNAFTTNAPFQKRGNVVTVYFEGATGDTLPVSIPEGFIPRSYVRMTCQVYSSQTSRRFMGTILFAPDGTIEGSVIPSYGDVTLEDIRQSKLAIFGSATWIV